MDYFTNALVQIKSLINVAIPLAVACAVLFFFWGMALYILRDDPRTREEGRGKMLWGVIAIFVIVSIWGIVGFFGRILDIGQGGIGAVPGIDNPL